MLSKLFPLISLSYLLLLTSCDPENPNNSTALVKSKVSNVKNCESSILNFEKEGSVNLYPIADRFDYTFKDKATNYKIGTDGNFTMNLGDGFYYFEVLNKNGEDIINGTFEIPSDLNSSGSLILSRVDKGGFVFERLPNGTIGNKVIPNVEITHIHEITGKSYVTTSNASGSYCVDLNPGRYRIIYSHPDYVTEDSGNGFNVFILDDEANRTSNLAMKKK